MSTNVTGLTPARHRAIFPKVDADLWSDCWNAAASIAGLRGGELEMQHLLAQVWHESAALTRLEENLYYSAARLRAVWPGRFQSDASAQEYAAQPRKLANFVYGGRLGNTGPDDGWRYCGRGALQVTGRANYTAFEAWLRKRGVPENLCRVVDWPDLLAQPQHATLSACWFWATQGCAAQVSPAIPEERVVIEVSRIINQHDREGLPKRQAAFQRVKQAWGGSA